MKLIRRMFRELFDFECLLSPIAVTRMKHIIDKHDRTSNFIGYTTIRIFGIGIIKIQSTKPWNNQ